jgi:hypothetical protein
VDWEGIGLSFARQARSTELLVGAVGVRTTVVLAAGLASQLA